MNALAVHVSKHALERYRRHIFDAADTEIVRRLNSASILKAAKLDRRLMTAANRRGGIQLFAKANSIPPKAAYDRLCKLRKAKATNGRAQG
jgi:hypothetical protein